MPNMWMVRSQGGELLPFFFNGIVVIGWRLIGDLSEKINSFLKMSFILPILRIKNQYLHGPALLIILFML